MTRGAVWWGPKLRHRLLRGGGMSGSIGLLRSVLLDRSEGRARIHDAGCTRACPHGECPRVRVPPGLECSVATSWCARSLLVGVVAASVAAATLAAASIAGVVGWVPGRSRGTSTRVAARLQRRSRGRGARRLAGGDSDERCR